MPLPYDLITDEPARIGLIVLQSDESIETDMRRLLPADVDLLVSRVPSGTAVSSESLRQMQTVLTQAASLFPADAQFPVVGYGCTSGAAHIGVDRIAELVRAGTKTNAVTQPVSALIAACRALDVKRIGLISPYIAQVSEHLRTVLSDNAIIVADFASFEQPQEHTVVRITPASIANAAISLAQAGGCDAIFLSCTNLRTLDIIDDVETATGLPILSSNQVLAWHMLQHVITAKKPTGPGRLWAAISQNSPATRTLTKALRADG